MHPYKPISSRLKHTYFICFFHSVYSSDWITLMMKGLWWANSWRKLFYVKPSFRNINNYGSPDNSCSKCALLRQISMMQIFSIVFYFFTFLPFMQNYWYFNEKCLMIGRKKAKGDLTCHNKPHFCFVRTNIIKMVMQSGIWPFEAKNNICSLTNFFLFTENLLPRNVWYWGMYFIEIIFIVVSMIC